MEETKIEEVVKVPCKICKAEYDKNSKEFNQFIEICRPCLPRYNLDTVVCFKDWQRADRPTLGKTKAAWISKLKWRYLIGIVDYIDSDDEITPIKKVRTVSESDILF